MKPYIVTKPFIAFGKAPEVGAKVMLDDGQAETLIEMESVTPYETKVLPKPRTKTAKKKKSKKPLASSQAGQAQPKKMRKNSKKSPKK